MEKMGPNPQWSTYVRRALTHGRVVGVDSSMWLFRKVPLMPVVDAKDSEKIAQATVPLMMLSNQLAMLANKTGKRRGLNKSSYREVQVLLTNLPFQYRPRPNMENADDLRQSYGDQNVLSRILAVGVKLQPKMSREGQSPVSAAIDSVVETLIDGGTPLEDYAKDYELIDKIMRQCGLVELGTDQFGRDEFSLINSWWNLGRTPEVPVLIHPDHIHVFRTISAAQVAKGFDQSECDDWRIKDSYALTMASISEFSLDDLTDDSPRALWAVSLLNQGVRALSIRARIEPVEITRAELERGRDRFVHDQNDRVSQGRSTKADMEKQIAQLTQASAEYATGGGTPTWSEVSVIAAIDGIHHDPARMLSGASIELGALPWRQQSAFAETFLCSRSVASPQKYELPSQDIACAGLSNLSTVGDSDGALLGLTERDRQPAYISPTAATSGDSAPALMIAGGTGTGKTMTILNLARQWAQLTTHRGEKTPVIVVDPKPTSDFSDPVRRLGGHVSSLDSPETSDGLYDPLRVIVDRKSQERFQKSSGEAIELAATMISSINPWSTGARQGFEVPLINALKFGLEHGATCTGEALRISLQAGIIGKDLSDPIFRLVESSNMARTLIGFNPKTQALRAAEGLTLVMVGDSRISLPDSGEGSWQRSTILQRVGTWVLRMMVYGSASAVANREGVIVLDEAWQFMIGDEGKSELDRLMRLARSQQILVVLATQKVSDFNKADLLGGFSRGLILPLETGSRAMKGNTIDYGEAGQALDLFELEKTPERLNRMNGKAKKEGSDEPNWDSMRALRDPATNKVIRGTIGLYVDLTGRVVPTEIIIPPDFLAQIATTSTDVIAREKAKAAAAAAANG